jgi:predicted enzyme related to lactoylglutathione lyase
MSDEPQDEGLPSPQHGQLSYLQIPALDVWRSAEFYELVFGWRVEQPYPSFEAPQLIGQWVDDRPPAPEAGPLLWIYVDDVEGALRKTVDAGGDVLEQPSNDGPSRILATIRDPAGNAVGIVQHTR